MNRIRRKRINGLIQRILENAGIDKPPVNVKKIAHIYQVEIKSRKYDGDDSLSGVLIRNGEQKIIGVNENHPKTRQRFTIAHELGHFFLHEGEQLFIDENNYQVNFRDSNASTGTDIKEVEANNFAGMLLIPTNFLMEDLKDGVVDILDEEHIQQLAKKYEVSEQAMILRLAKL